MKSITITTVLLAGAPLLVLSSCGGNGDGTSPPAGAQGTAEIIDAPNFDDDDYTINTASGLLAFQYESGGWILTVDGEEPDYWAWGGELFYDSGYFSELIAQAGFFAYPVAFADRGDPATAYLISNLPSVAEVEDIFGIQLDNVPTIPAGSRFEDIVYAFAGVIDNDSLFGKGSDGYVEFDGNNHFTGELGAMQISGNVNGMVVTGESSLYNVDGSLEGWAGIDEDDGFWTQGTILGAEGNDAYAGAWAY